MRFFSVIKPDREVKPYHNAIMLLLEKSDEKTEKRADGIKCQAHEASVFP